MSAACCRECRGLPPYQFCRDPYQGVLDPGCDCHQRQDAVARRKRATFYRDPTANTAIGRAMKGISK